MSLPAATDARGLRKRTRQMELRLEARAATPGDDLGERVDEQGVANWSAVIVHPTIHSRDGRRVRLCYRASPRTSLGSCSSATRPTNSAGIIKLIIDGSIQGHRLTHLTLLLQPARRERENGLC